jgi:deazaflavin-dependent oxidoreductase (nitroreductase family)
MDDRVRRALSRGHLIDITTTGRRTGRARRIEVVFHNFGGHIYISGMPGRRGWYANLVTNPRFTFHLKGPVKADLAATARAITDPAERQRVFADIARVWRNQNPEMMIRRSPLVEVTIDQAAADAASTEPAAVGTTRERGTREAG